MGNLLEAWDVCISTVPDLWKTTYFKFCTKCVVQVSIASKILLLQLINWQGFFFHFEIERKCFSVSVSYDPVDILHILYDICNTLD